MTKKKPAQKKSNGKRVARRPRAVVRRSPQARTGPAEYLRMLANPCGADISVPSAYDGIGSSFVYRTTDFITPAAGGAGTAAHTLCSVTPGGNMFANTASAAIGSNLTTSTTNYATFLRNNAKRARCKAACLEWLPTGSTSNRSGLVGSGLAPAQAFGAGETANITQFLTLANRTVSNGSEKHEIRWVPSQADASWFDPATALSGLGTQIYLAIQGADAVAGVPSGIFKFTAVWEWEPNTLDNAPMAVGRPAPYTLQTVLSMIPDIAAFATAPMAGGAGILGAMSSAGGSLAAKGLVRYLGASAMPTIGYGV